MTTTTKNGAKGGDQGSFVDLPDMQQQLQSGCPFCSPAANRILVEDELTRTITDGFPVSPGHTLIIPKRHVATFFEATDAEQSALLCSLGTAKTLIEARHQPDGYNIGINNGAAAGQTVPHLHIHLIPRYLGDIPDPRGGVRWVLPEKAKYWGEMK